MAVTQPESPGVPRRRDIAAPYTGLALPSAEESRTSGPAPAPARMANASVQTRRRVQVYILALSIAAAAVGSTIAALWPDVTAEHLAVAAAMMIVMVVAELVNYRRSGGASGSVGHIPILALALVVPQWPTLLAAAFACFIVAIAQRRPLDKALFNASQTTLAAGAAIVTFLAFGGAPLETLPRNALLTPQIALAAIAADIALVLVNSSAVSGVLALSTGKSFTAIWRESTLATALYVLFTAPFFAGLAWAIVH